MKKKLLKIVATTFFMMAGAAPVASLSSCASGDDVEKVYNANITDAKEIVITENTGYLKLNNGVTQINFEEYITVSDDATYVISADEAYSDTSTKTFQLVEGNNVFYLRVTAGDNSKTRDYVITIYRKQKFTITFDMLGGNKIDKILIDEGSTFDPSSVVATRAGYNCIGFIDDKNTLVTSDYVIERDVTMQPIWEPRNDTQYTVKHFYEDETGVYSDTPDQITTETGTTGTLTSAVAIPEDGFITPEVIQDSIASDGSTSISLYYKRTTYSMELTDQEYGETIVYINGIETTDFSAIRFGSDVKIVGLPNTGYQWLYCVTEDGTQYVNDSTPSFKMPKENISLYSIYAPATDTAYTVIHIKESAYSGPETAATDTLYGTTGELTAAVANNYTGYTATWFDQQKIKADGSTVIEILYVPNDYQLNVEISDDYAGTIEGDQSGTYNYTTGCSVTATVNEGYIFKGWYEDSKLLTTNTTYDFIMPYKNYTIRAVYESKSGIKYTVKYLQQNIDDDNYTEVEEDRKELTGTASSMTEAVANTYEGFDLAEFNQVKIKGDGSTVVEIKYNRKTYEVSFDDVSVANGTLTGSGTYRYGKQVTLSATKIYLGYVPYWKYGTFTSKDAETTITITSGGTIQALKVSDAMAAYEFTSTETTCEITNVSSTALTNYEIPSYVTGIKNGAFASCTSITSLTLPFANNINCKYLSCLFGGTTAADNAQVPPTLTDVKILKGDVHESFFANVSSIVNVTLPEDITSIDDMAFYKCTSLKNITIPSGVVVIGNSVFSYDSSLVNIVLPDTVSTLGTGAFHDCTSLETITLSAGLYTIENSLLENCYSLKEVTIPSKVRAINGNAFQGDTLLKSVTIPDSVVSIGDYTFAHCSSLEKLVIPDSVTSIGLYAFSDCSSLLDVTISKKVTSLSDSTFSGCIKLENLVLPDNIVFGDDVFSSCRNVTSVTILCSGARTAFSGYTSLFDISDLSNVTSITIGEGYEKLEEVGYTACTKLTLPKSMTSVADDSISGDTLPNLIRLCVPVNTTLDLSNAGLESIASFNTLELVFDENNTSLDRDITEIFGGTLPYIIRSLDIGEGCLSIKSGVSNLTGIIELELPYSLEEMSEKVFDGDDSLRILRLPVNPKAHLTDDASEFGSTGLNVLYIYPTDSSTSYAGFKDYGGSIPTWIKSLYLEEGITVLEDEAFSGCTNISTISLSTTLESIGNYAFAGCTALKSVKISSTVTSLGSNLFDGSGITDVYFGGTQEAWENAGGTIDDNITYHFNS